jgi:TonB family protein
MDMNPALFYRPRGRWTFWIAFVCAAGLHIGAVVLAKNKSESAKLENFSPAEGEVELVETEPKIPSPEQSITPRPVEQIPPDQDSFQEENLTPPPVRLRTKSPPAVLVKGAVALFGSVKAMVTYAPRPVYPYEARRQRITGSGKALLIIDPTLGTVTDVQMVQSCGSAILDNATLAALRRWHFRAGTAARVQVPITYTLTGASY